MATRLRLYNVQHGVLCAVLEICYFLYSLIRWSSPVCFRLEDIYAYLDVDLQLPFVNKFAVELYYPIHCICSHIEHWTLSLYIVFLRLYINVQYLNSVVFGK